MKFCFELTAWKMTFTSFNLTAAKSSTEFFKRQDSSRVLWYAQTRLEIATVKEVSLTKTIRWQKSRRKLLITASCTGTTLNTQQYDCPKNEKDQKVFGKIILRKILILPLDETGENSDRSPELQTEENVGNIISVKYLIVSVKCNEKYFEKIKN